MSDTEFAQIAKCKSGNCQHLNRDLPEHGRMIEEFYGLINGHPLDGVLASNGPIIFKYGSRLPRRIKKLARRGAIVINT